LLHRDTASRTGDGFGELHDEHGTARHAANDAAVPMPAALRTRRL
jgi:hypothetical protein